MKKRHQNLWDAARAVLREKCIALNALKIIIKKETKSIIQLRKLEKEE